MTKTISSIIFKFLFLVASISMLSACNSGGGDDEANYKNSIENTENTESSVGYIQSANIVVTQLWIRDSEGVEQQLLTTPETVKLVPSSNDVAEMQVDLDIPPGDYDRVRLVLESGEVTLLDNAIVADDNIFNTESGDLKFPSGYQTGIKVNIEPSIEVVSTLSQDLILSFNLTKSFVFNGPITHAPGVKRVLFKPVIQATNDSTHGRIMLKVSGSNGIKCNSDDTALEDVTVTAIDTSGLHPDVMINTDEQGDASIRLLPGLYDILIESNGYEPVTLQNNQIYIANKTELGDISLSKDLSAAGFDKDTVILMAIMSQVAYGRSAAANPIVNWETVSEGDTLPRPVYGYNLSLIDEYQGECWKLFRHIPGDDFIGLPTQLFIAYNEDNNDLIVSFEGSVDQEDFVLDFSIAKSLWPQRTGNYDTIDLPILEAAVHNGIGVIYTFVAPSIKTALDDFIEKKLPDPSNSRIYFTGHSLGGNLATLASLDFANYLVETHQFKRNNIIMYSYGASRVMTNRLAQEFETIVPSGYAIAAKDDLVPYFPGLGSNLDFAYSHIEKLLVLSTNINDPSDSKSEGSYNEIGETRIEHKKGLPLKTCSRIGPGAPGVLASPYGKKGHHSLQYIRRLETLTDDGKPGIGIVADDISDSDSILPNWKLRLDWSGGVRGPCDWVALYHTTDGLPPADPDKYLNYLLLGADIPPTGNWQWAAEADSYTTIKNPTYYGIPTLNNPTGIKVESGDFWIGYVDGFGEFLMPPIKWDRKLN